jgi:hypothetical protein
MAEQFDELARGDSVLYGGCGGIWVMVLFAPPTKPDMLLAGPTLAAMRRRVGHPFPTLTWVLSEAGYRMEADARKAATDVTTEHAASLSAQATLVEGAGFQAAAVRAIISGLDAISRTGGKKSVFSDLGDAVAWCLDFRHDPHAPANEATIVQALEEARRHRARPRL